MDGGPPTCCERTHTKTNKPAGEGDSQTGVSQTHSSKACYSPNWSGIAAIAFLIMRWPSRSRTTPLCLKIRRKPNRVLHMRARGRDSTSCLTTAPAEVATIREYDGTDVPLLPVH